MERLTANFQIFAVCFYLLAVVFELVISIRHRRRNYYDKQDTRTNLFALVGMAIVGQLALIPMIMILQGILDILPYQLPTTWWSVLIALLLVDHSNYWAHRFGHETNLGWAMHVTHHSTRHYNLSVALRQNWSQVLLFVFFLPIPLFGLPVYVILFAKALNSFYQFWIHTEYINRLPRWFEFVFNTPSHHRVHHASNTQYLDRNYAGIFIFWDRLYGTFKREEARPVYGLTPNIDRHDQFYVQFHHWQALLRNYWRAPDWRTRLHVLFAPPGAQRELPPISRAEIKPWMPFARLLAPKTLA
ncbi:MAG: sterol desaturase family protein [Bacteroidota bacterium]